MHDTMRHLFQGAVDSRPRVVTPILGLRAVTLRSPSEEEAGFGRHDTPLLPASFPTSSESRATLTVLTGLQAGRLEAMNGAPVTIGRAPDAALVVDDPGVSWHHARIARSAAGAYYAEDLGSTNGTYLRSVRIGVAPLHGGDLLQLGPHVRVRFAVLDAVEEQGNESAEHSLHRVPRTIPSSWRWASLPLRHHDFLLRPKQAVVLREAF